MAALAMMITGLTNATPASAAPRCVGDGEPGLYRNVNTKTLRGYSVTLQSGSSSAAARARSVVPPGGIISIDRSINQFTPTAAERANGHGWRTNAQVTSNGGWDYCETFNNSSTTYTLNTRSVEGSHNAVRQCLRVAGVVQCSDQWYVDFDD